MSVLLQLRREMLFFCPIHTTVEMFAQLAQVLLHFPDNVPEFLNYIIVSGFNAVKGVV